MSAVPCALCSASWRVLPCLIHLLLFLACSCSTLIPVSVVTKWSPYVCLSVFSTSYRDISHIGLERKKRKWVAQLYLTLCNPMDCNLPGFFIHSIFQARVPEWVAISFSRESSQPRDQTQVSRIASRRFTLWVTREALTGLEDTLNQYDLVSLNCIYLHLQIESHSQG